MLLVILAAVLKGSCYYNNMHINVSFRGKVRPCSRQIQDERRLEWCYRDLSNFFMGNDASVENCQRSHLI